MRNSRPVTAGARALGAVVRLGATVVGVVDGDVVGFVVAFEVGFGATPRMTNIITRLTNIATVKISKTWCRRCRRRRRQR